MSLSSEAEPVTQDQPSNVPDPSSQEGRSVLDGSIDVKLHSCVERIYFTMKAITEELRVIVNADPEWFERFGVKEGWLDIQTQWSELRQTLQDDIEKSREVAEASAGVLKELPLQVPPLEDSNVSDESRQLKIKRILTSTQTVVARFNSLLKLAHLVQSGFEGDPASPDPAGGSEMQHGSIVVQIQEIGSFWHAAQRGLDELLSNISTTNNESKTDHERIGTLTNLLSTNLSHYADVVSAAETHERSLYEKIDFLELDTTLKTFVLETYAILAWHEDVQKILQAFDPTASRDSLAEGVLEALQKVMDIHRKSQATIHFHVFRRILLRGAAQALQKLPPSYYLSNVSCDKKGPNAIGGFGSVYRAQWKRSDENSVVVAVKVCNGDAPLREIIIWRQLEHPNIQQFLGVDKELYAPKLALVSMWEDHGDVSAAIKAFNTKYLQTLRPQWVKEIAKGLAYLHKERIVHGDLRGLNVLIDQKLHARLTDFGLTTLADSNTRTNGPRDGQIPLAWSAPELLGDKSVPDFACDIYSYAMTCIELYSAQKPFGMLNSKQITGRLFKGLRPVRPTRPVNESKVQEMPDAIWDLICECWDEEPNKRPAMSKVVDRVAEIVPDTDKMEHALLVKVVKLREEEAPVGGLVHEAYQLFPSLSVIRDIAQAFTSQPISDVQTFSRDFLQAIQEILDQRDPETDRRQSLGFLLRGANTLRAYPKSYYLSSVAVGSYHHYASDEYLSDIYEAKWMGKDVECKFLETDEPIAEVILWRQLHHPNIQYFYGVIDDSDTQVPSRYPALISTWEINLSVDDVMKKLYPPALRNLRPQWAKQIADAVAYMHEEHIVHGDLRGSNIRIDDQLHARLTSLSFATLDGTHNKTSGPRGSSVDYSAPELFKDKPVLHFASDVYSFAMTCLELYTSTYPFPSFSLSETRVKVLEGERPPRPQTDDAVKIQEIPDNLWSLMCECWAQDASTRPSMSTVVDKMGEIIPEKDEVEHALLVKLVKSSSIGVSLGDFVYEAYRLYPALSSIREIAQAFAQNAELDESTYKQDFLEGIQEILSEEQETASWQQALSFLLRGAITLAALPRSYHLSSVTVDESPQPTRASSVARVYRAKWEAKDVECKVSQSEVEQHISEIILWRQLRHPSIQTFFGVSSEVFQPDFAVISTWEVNGSVSDAGGRLSLRELQVLRPRWMKEIADGLSYLHEKRVVHGDLRGDNILIDYQLHARLTGFSLTTLADSTHSHTGTHTAGPRVGSIPYAWSSPELFDDESRPQLESDVYSFAMTCIELYSGQTPFYGLRERQMVSKILEGERPPRPASGSIDSPKAQNIPDRLWTLICDCWNQTASDRPEMPAVVDRIAEITPEVDEVEHTLLVKLVNSSPQEHPLGELVHEVYQLDPSLPAMQTMAETLTNSDGQINAEDVLQALQDVLDATGRATSNTVWPALLRLFLKGAKTFDTLPHSYYLQGVMLDANEVVGEEHPGNVYRGVWESQEVALKVLRDLEAKFALRSALMWRQLRHQSIQPILGVTKDAVPSSLAVVSRWEGNGSVVTAMRTLHSQVLETLRPIWIIDIVQGLKYLHDNHIVHDDLRGSSILITAANRARVMDSGFSILADSPATGSREHTIPSAWAAPELLKDEQRQPSLACDVFSFACTCVEIYSGDAPFVGLTDVEAKNELVEGNRPSQPTDGERSQVMPEWLWDLVVRCWAQEPSERPTVDEIVQEIESHS